jgi:hypothetical protein
MKGQKPTRLSSMLVLLAVIGPGVLARPVDGQDSAPIGPAAFTSTAPFIVNVVVNNTDPALIGSDSFGDTQTSIAVNPQNPNEILITTASGIWTAMPPGSTAPWWHSTDGGQTWTKRFTIPQPPGHNVVGCPCYETIDFGRNNRVFGTFRTGAQIFSGGSSNAASAAAFLYHAPGGITQRTNVNGLGLPDNPRLLVNRDPASPFQDNVYVAYANFSTTPVDLRVSTALGSFPPNFVRDVRVGTSAGAINPGLRLAVDPRTGWVYTVWQTCIGPCAIDTDPKNIDYRLNRSRDGGATWDFDLSGTRVSVGASSQPLPKFGTVNRLHGGVLHAAVDPRNSEVYVVYGVSLGPGAPTNRLALRKLTPDQITMPGPERSLPTHGLSQAIPAVAVADNGVVGVFHYSFDGLSPGSSLPIFTAWLDMSDDQGVTWTSRALMTFLAPFPDSCPVGALPDDPCQNQSTLGHFMQMKAVGNTFYGAFTANGVPFGRPFGTTDPIFFKVAATGTAELDLVLRGTDQGIYRNHFSNGAFEGFQFLGGSTAATPALVARDGGAFDLVVRGTDSGVYHSRFDGTAFSGFASVGGLTPDVPVIVQGNYRAVASTGAAIVPGVFRIDGAGCDQCFFQLALPFPVRFYGRLHHGLLVSSNGNVQFQGSAGPATFGNSALPSFLVEKAIFAWWDDLDTTGPGQGIFTRTLGSPPNRQFVIEWRTGFFGSGSTNFEIIFTENSPVITVIYGSSSGPRAAGISATAGVQLRGTGPHFTQFSFNQDVLTPGLRIDYVPAELELVVRGTDNGLYHNTFNGTGWTGYTFLGGSTASRPALAAGPNGTLELVVRGTDNRIYHNRFNGAGWTGFVNLGGATPDAPALASRSTGVDLVVRGTDNGVYHNRFTFSSATWSGFIAVGGTTLATPALVTSTRTASADRLDLVLRGTDSGIYYNHFNGLSWIGYVAIPGATAARPALAASTAPGNLDLVIRGTNNGIYYSHFNGAAWSPFVALPGSMLSEPVLVSP